MSGGTRAPVKVKIINTQYVEIDKVNFKSIVQSLTGKDSVVAPGRKTASPEVKWTHGSSALSRDLSFKELDRLLMELPSMDELHRLWGD
ncbi:hypothetical protein HHK36_003497 [Tetracentron sinense]|uniref:VQ domain-containing protein n=1 Tax=Tetracentron sinense TaxID=13715 RepID=A0A834ZP63_TETSI|nr:hypothetical protein HHK36_003497 [Tetracentron sinense]